VSEGAWRVLILEDDVLPAIDLAEQLTSAGFEVLGPVTSVANASQFIQRCDCAIIDVNLHQETSEPIAALLRKLGTPFIVLTGYTEPGPGFEGGQVLRKPVQFAELMVRLTRLLPRAA